jgi:hypothetical protein
LSIELFLRQTKQNIVVIFTTKELLSFALTFLYQIQLLV